MNPERPESTPIEPESEDSISEQLISDLENETENTTEVDQETVESIQEKVKIFLTEASTDQKLQYNESLTDFINDLDREWRRYNEKTDVVGGDFPVKRNPMHSRLYHVLRGSTIPPSKENLVSNFDYHDEYSMVQFFTQTINDILNNKI